MDETTSPQMKKLGRPRKHASDKERQHATYINRKRRLLGLPPEEPAVAVPEPPAGAYSLADYLKELDSVAEFARAAVNPAALARVAELRAKACGLLDTQQEQAARYSLIIHTEVREDAGESLV